MEFDENFCVQGIGKRNFLKYPAEWILQGGGGQLFCRYPADLPKTLENVLK